MQYSKAPNNTKSSVFTSFDSSFTENNRLTYFKSDAFVDSISGNIDNSYNLVVLNNALVTTLGTVFHLDIDLPVMTLTNGTYTGGEKIHYFTIYNASSEDINVTPWVSPSSESVTVIGDSNNQIEIQSGNTVEISIKVVGSYWIVTKSQELNLVGTIVPS